MLDQAHDIVGQWVAAATANRGSFSWQVSTAAFRCLRDGQMPTIRQIAATLSHSETEVETEVRALAAAGRIYFDEEREVITGAGGLSLVESRHTLDMAGRRFWVWCALDAVGIPAGLAVDATVISRASDTGERVRIEITGGEFLCQNLAELSISLVPPSLNASLTDACCSQISFYELPQNIPQRAQAVDVRTAMHLGRRLWGDGVPL